MAANDPVWCEGVTETNNQSDWHAFIPGMWYVWLETWNDWMGPFLSRDEAHSALRQCRTA